MPVSAGSFLMSVKENLTPEENKMQEVLWNKRYKNAGYRIAHDGSYLKDMVGFPVYF